MKKNWFTIFDNTKDGRTLFVSDSVRDCIQYEPEELMGKTAFEFFHPNDIENIKTNHRMNVNNEFMSSMSTFRYRCKPGNYIMVDVVVIYCYDTLVVCNYVVNEEYALEHKMRISQIDEWYLCIPEGPLQHVSGFKKYPDLPIPNDKVWTGTDQLVKPPQKRVYLILNRFSDGLDIMFASSLASELLGIDAESCIGRSIYDFLPELDCLSLQTHVDLSKKHDIMFRLRFDWIIDKESNLSEQMEGITSCTNDGLVMVLRLAPRTKLKLFEEK